MVAIERYKAVRDIKRNEQLSGKTVRTLVLLCILTSAVFTIPFIWLAMNDDERCRKLDSLNNDVKANFISFMIPATLTTLTTLSVFILIVVLYVKICIVVKKTGGLGTQSCAASAQQEFFAIKANY